MSLVIDITSDTVCPWCFVGKRRLEEGLADARDVSVTWHPFLLDPRVPRQGMPLDAYLQAKFGPRERFQPMIDRLTAIGAECGIDFAWDRILTRPNSIDSHRVIRWALESGGAELQNAVVERLFRAYWEQGRDIGSPAVLAELAAEAGMDAADTARRLATEVDRDTVVTESQQASHRGVTGVPDFVIGESDAPKRFRLVGAQPPYYFQRAFERLGAA